MAPIVIACIYFGGVSFLFLTLFLSLFSINEFYFLMQKKGFQPTYLLGNFFTAFFIIVAFLALKKNWEPAHSAVTVLGMIYVGWFFSYLFFIRALTAHGAFLFFLVITIWFNDSGAYLVGKTFGRHRLNPLISPKKTIEGAVAGFLISIIAAIIFSYFIQMGLVHAIILGIIVGGMAQVSDLVESMLKRDAGVKDSGQVFPGHGGVLDRMDSFILTAPIMYYYIVWIGLG
ncbi:MAG: phosphatidate cytidylyltransferase [Candidatus Saganbacteria bacterium]|nr:phosphatidate cytidylyltransferase [Candidatus Saganbacteria bacterium]